MKATKRELRYARENFNEVHHCTLNPDGPGVVRIHLVPPLVRGEEVGVSVAILNGQDVVPVNTSWSILLTEFIRAVNRYAGRAVTDDDVRDIQDATCKAVRRVYPTVRKRRLKRDIYAITRTFAQVARGEPTDIPIGRLSLGEYAPRMRAPHRMDLMVSAMEKGGRWNCNQACVHCYAAGQEHASEPELSTAQWRQVIDRCRAAGIPQITFTGGEPTMRADLVELVEYAKWFVTRLNTNGVKLTSEYCRALREASLDSLQVTLYSHDARVHDELVGAPHHADTVAGIGNALAAGLNMSVNTPLCAPNRDYIGTLEFLRGMGVTYVTCSGLITTGGAATPESERLQLSEDELRDILQDAAAFCYRNGMEMSFTSPGWADTGFCREIGVGVPTCGACLSNMAVTPAGLVVPCQSWLSGPALGNILADDWEGIWNSETCRARREHSAKMLGDCPLRVRRRGGEEALAAESEPGAMSEPDGADVTNDGEAR